MRKKGWAREINLNFHICAVILSVYMKTTFIEG